MTALSRRAPQLRHALIGALIGTACGAAHARAAHERALGVMRGTYYYLARAGDHETQQRHTALVDRSCGLIARVPPTFAADLRLQGSGALTDGRVVNLVRGCRCGHRRGPRLCCVELDPARFPYGMGARDNPLVPLRSVAVDRRRVALGSTLYIAAFDGLRIPRVDGLGGFVHDGCFAADDVGVRGMRLDLFAGTRRMWRALERLVPTKRRLRVVQNATRCARRRAP